MREQEIYVLEAAAAAYRSDPGVFEQGLDGLLATLDLQPGQREEFVDALLAGRWRRSPNPYECVTHATRRCGRVRSVAILLIGDISVPADWESEGSNESDRLTMLSTRSEDSELHELDEAETPKGIHRVRPELKIHEEAPEWLREVCLDPSDSVDWGQVAQRAKLDEWGADALEYKASGVSLYAALQDQPSDEARKSLRAGWARMERRLKSGKIRKILEKSEFSTGKSVLKGRAPALAEGKSCD